MITSPKVMATPTWSFAFVLSRHFPWRRATGYWTAQLAGAIVAALLLRASLGNIADMGATLPSGSQAQSFLWELVMTAFLMFVILAVATTRGPSERRPRLRSAERLPWTRCSAVRSRAPR